MAGKFFVRWVVAAGACALLAACATPSPVAGEFRPVTPRQAQHTDVYNHLTVRWGGVLISTRPKASETCFTVLSLPLTGQGWPESDSGQANQGRFIACARGFHDPQQYRPGRRITFIGPITGHVTRKVGGYAYRYPTMKARKVHLWPKSLYRRPPDVIYINGLMNPYPPCMGWPPGAC